MASREARHALINLARARGILVTEFDAEPDVFVTCGLLPTACVRVDLVGLHDLVVRVGKWVDNRPVTVRAGMSAQHARTCDMMLHHRSFLREQSLIYYDAQKQIVKNWTDPMRYRTAREGAVRAMNQHDRT